jgi:hypothetical protein
MPLVAHQGRHVGAGLAQLHAPQARGADDERPADERLEVDAAE